jgi:hypothetical protein
MAITHVGTSAPVFGANDITPSLAGLGAQAGDMMLLVVGGKPYNAGFGGSMAPGWNTGLGPFTDGTVAAGTDIGSMQIRGWWKEHDGSEADPLVDEGSPTWNIMGALIMVFRKGAGEVWETPVAVGGGDSSAGTGFSVTAGSNPGVIAGDVCITAGAFRSDAATPCSNHLDPTQTGVAFTHTHDPATDPETTSGGDMGMCVTRSTVSGTGTAAPVLAATLAASHTGSAIFIRLRATTPAAPVELQISGVRIDLTYVLAPPSFTADLDATEGADTANIDGKHGPTAILAEVEANDTANIDGTHVPPPITADLDSSEANDTANIDGTHVPPPITADLDSSEANDTANIDGKHGPTAILAEVEANDTANIDGAVVPPNFTADLDAAEGADTANIDGTRTVPNWDAVLEVLEQDDVANIDGTRTVPDFAAILDSTEEDDQASFTGGSGQLALLDAVEADDIADLAGTHTPPDFAAVLDSSEGDDTADLAGTHTPPSFTAVLGASEALDVAALVTTVANPIDGVLVAVEGDDEMQWFGFAFGPGPWVVPDRVSASYDPVGTGLLPPDEPGPIDVKPARVPHTLLD